MSRLDFLIFHLKKKIKLPFPVGGKVGQPPWKVLASYHMVENRLVLTSSVGSLEDVNILIKCISVFINQNY